MLSTGPCRRYCSVPRRSYAPAPMSASIGLRGLAKSFGTLPVVAPLTLDIAPGSFVSLVGPSGCGKSTLLRLIAGLEAPTEGTATVDGAAPSDARDHKRIAVVPQQPGLLPWRTVAANARLLLDVNRRAPVESPPDPLELLDEVGLSAFLGAYPHQLSGGMQQRVALVRAFALGAPLVLMDEPFAALDEITRAEMRDLLARMLERRSTTVVFVTHSISEAVYLSDRVLVCSPRPTRIVADVDVPLDRPRIPDIEDRPAFAELCATLRHELRESMDAAS
jgi:NitT/TauT family transport system ATP-binding protein